MLTMHETQKICKHKISFSNVEVYPSKEGDHLVKTKCKKCNKIWEIDVKEGEDNKVHEMLDKYGEE